MTEAEMLKEIRSLRYALADCANTMDRLVKDGKWYPDTMRVYKMAHGWLAYRNCQEKRIQACSSCANVWCCDNTNPYLKKRKR